MVLRDRIDDHRLPLTANVVQGGVNIVEGFGADPVRTERTVALVSAERMKPLSGLDRLKLEIRYGGLERVADNFTFRPETASTNRNEARPSRHEIGGTLSGDVPLAEAVLARLSLSTNRIWHDGTRWGGPGTSLTTISGYQYPGVEMWENAANLDLAWKPAAATKVNLGLRYDYVVADAAKLDQTMRVGAYSGTARSLYASYFGAGIADSRDDHLVSIKLDGEQALLNDRLALTGSLGRIMRAADTQERYFALPSAAGATASGTSSRQVGNSDLDPEQHYRAEAGVALKGDDWLDYGRKRPGGDDGVGSRSWRLSLNGHVDQVMDFISRDRAHGQSGVLLNDNAFIWRNVDARLAGADAEAAWNLSRHWSTRLLVNYRWGENTSDGRALYGIDPLEANWLVDYQDTAPCAAR